MGYAGEFELLLLLAVLRLGDDAYGVTVREEVERRTSRTVSLGAVYKTLGRMERKGYLRTHVAPPTAERGGRRKKMYTLTPKGVETTRQSVADVHRMTQGIEHGLDLP